MSTGAVEQFSLFGRAPMLRDDAPVPHLVSVPPGGGGGGVITARDYQQRADAGIDEALAKYKSTLAVLATGTGKTIIFALQARKRGCALVIAHRDSLIQQAALKLRHVTGEYVGIEKAERRARPGSKFIVASVQTLKGERLAGFAETHREAIDFIVVDEGHRGVAPSYRAIYAAFPDAKRLLVTATPDRGDKKAMALVAESVAFRYEIVEAVDDAWLTEGSIHNMDVSGVSLDSIGLKGGDLDQDQLDVAVAEVAAQAASSVAQHCQGRRTLVFTPGVQTALVGAAALNRITPDCARAVHGEMDDDEKAQIIGAHRRGEFPYLLNCAVLTEGYDDPELVCIVMLGKTKSRAKWAQVYGRGGRLWPHGIDHLPTVEERRAAIAASPKPCFCFFDAHYGKHGHTLACAVDVLGGKYDEATRKRAKRIMGAEGGRIGVVLERAKAEIEAEKLRKLARAAALASRATGKVKLGRARTRAEMYGQAAELDDGPGAPFDVVGFLVGEGIKDAATFTPEKQQKYRRRLVERKRLGLASYKQFRRLDSLGVPDAKAVTAKRAGLILGNLSVGKHQYRRFEARRDGHLLGRESAWAP